tara:strand:+ start:13 stop:600 length:588 start_codon:yes stop_codon:yes gene_type:complete
MSKSQFKKYASIIDKRGFDHADLRFLCRRTGFKNEEKMASLIEEDADLDLVLETIKELPLVRRQTSRLSLKFLFHLLIYKYSSKRLTGENKLFIANFTADYFCLIIGAGEANVSVDFSKPPKESDATLIFVLNGLFSDYFEKFFDNEEKYNQIRSSHIQYIKMGLEKYDAESWAEEGLETLNRIAEEGWLKRFFK